VQAAIVEVDAEKVAKAGDTMTGHLTLPTGPAAANAVRKDYVDGAVLAGGTYTGKITTVLNTNNIATNGAGSTALEVRAANPTDAMMSFHVTGAFAANFGMKTDGNFYMGGWSHATNIWKFWTQRDFNYIPVNKAGDTMSGLLTCNAGLTVNAAGFNVAGNINGHMGSFVNANTGTSAHTPYFRSGNDSAWAFSILNAAQTSWAHYMTGAGHHIATGTLQGATLTATGNIWAHGGVLYLSAQGHYISWGASVYQFPHGNINVGGGNIDASGSVTGGAHVRAGNGYWYSGWGGHYFHYDGVNFSIPWGDLRPSGNVWAGGHIGCTAESNFGVRLRISSGNYVSFFWDGNLKIYVDGGHVKNFVIDHPVDPNRWLIHGCLEGPEAGVYYRGEAELTGASMEVELPSYFTALVDETTASVQVTPILTTVGKDLDACSLAASRVRNGRFTVARTGSGLPSKHAQPFFWRVEATRRDVKPLNVEPLKSAVNVYGDGPYRYYEEK
jgi:hypothetical protein